MYKLCVTELAQNDLDSIIGYIAVKLENPTAAGNLLCEIEKCCADLRRNPLMFSKSTDPRLEKEGYRKAIVKNYLLMFKVNEAQKTVTVYRIFYGPRDYQKLL